MPAAPAPELSTAEQSIVDRFEAAPEPEEIRVERVARAICDGDAEDHGTYTWAEASELDRGELQDDYRRSARHAIAALELR
jgi:hypothetical protein